MLGYRLLLRARCVSRSLNGTPGVFQISSSVDCSAACGFVAPSVIDQRTNRQWSDLLLKSRSFSSLPPHTKLYMPSLSPTMKMGNIAAWHVKEGDKVSVGDLLADVETDKATLDWDTVEEGVLAKILYPAGAKNVPVGTEVAILVEEVEMVPAFKSYAPSRTAKPLHKSSASPPPPAPPGPAPAAPSGTGEAPPSPPTGQGMKHIGPAVQRLLRQNALDVSAVHGTGPHGIVIKGDVLAALKGPRSSPPPPQKSEADKAVAAPQPPPPPPPRQATAPAEPAPSQGSWKKPPKSERYTDIPNSQIRKIIASRLLESKTTVPHAYARADVELEPLSMLRNSLKEQDIKVSVNDLIVKACAMALREVPQANAQWSEAEKRVVFSSSIDISIAVATDKGLITPIVRNADQKSLVAISAEVRDLAARARANKLKVEEFQGGTFSISNLGMFGVDYFSAIINPPQACILAVGGMRHDVLMGPDGLHDVPKLTVTVSCDARVVDGDVAGAFLKALASHLHNAPALLVYN